MVFFLHETFISWGMLLQILKSMPAYIMFRLLFQARSVVINSAFACEFSQLFLAQPFAWFLIL
jgi:hypothetical protein